MMRMITVALLALILAACGSSSSPPPMPVPPAGPIVIGSAPWELQASNGVSVDTTPISFVGPSWSLTMPTAAPGLHYVVTPVAGHISGTLNAQYHIVRDPGAQFVGVQQCPGSASGPVMVLYFQEAGDNWSGVLYPSGPDYRAFRWWAAPTALNAADSGIISAAIDPSLWSDVQGQKGTDNPAGFGGAAANVQTIGITFGGGCDFGHGVYVTGGNATFVMDRFWIQ